MIASSSRNCSSSRRRHGLGSVDGSPARSPPPPALARRRSALAATDGVLAADAPFPGLRAPGASYDYRLVLTQAVRPGHLRHALPSTRAGGRPRSTRSTSTDPGHRWDQVRVVARRARS
jgi:hypothetical protein